MTTEWTKIKSANENFPDDTLEFVTGASGNYFFIQTDGKEDGLKFWFDKESWEKLKSSVDSVIE